MSPAELVAALRSLATATEGLADTYEREWRLDAIRAAIDDCERGAYGHAALNLSIVPGAADLHREALALEDAHLAALAAEYDEAEQRFYERQAKRTANGEIVGWSL